MPRGKRASEGDVLTGDELRVKADPDKLFFIDMLVRDIELVPAVLDLVDNSVDSARAVALAQLVAEGSPMDIQVEPDHEDAVTVAVENLPADAFNGLRVDIVATAKQFSITDNCEGMDVDTAKDYAFRFGRPKDHVGVPGSVGQFGVGMKRALFKMGSYFTVASRTDSTAFELEVDVHDWAVESGTDWHFTMKSASKDLQPDAAGRGTAVAVTRLHPSTSEDFGDPVIVGQLREHVRLRHQAALSRGLVITLNGEMLKGLLPQVLSGPNFGAINKTFVVKEPEGDVFVRLIAGVVASDRKNVDEGQAEAFTTPGDAGWWVFCNERLLLAADRSPETGWGNPAASYHPQYRTFRGYVYLQALNAALLPWNTTKTDVDQDSRVWRAVQSEMRRTLVEVQSVINRLKTERASLADDEIEYDQTPPPTPVTDARDAAVLTSLRDLPPSPFISVPPPPPRPPAGRRPVSSNWQKVQYNVDKGRFEKVAGVLDVQNAAEIGRRTFDYFFKREVDES